MTAATPAEPNRSLRDLSFNRRNIVETPRRVLRLYPRLSFAIDPRSVELEDMTLLYMYIDRLFVEVCLDHGVKNHGTMGMLVPWN